MSRLFRPRANIPPVRWPVNRKIIKGPEPRPETAPTIRDACNHRPAVQLHVKWNLIFAAAALIARPIRNLASVPPRQRVHDDSTGVALHSPPGDTDSAMPFDNHPPHLSSCIQWTRSHSLKQSGRTARTYQARCTCCAAETETKVSPIPSSNCLVLPLGA